MDKETMKSVVAGAAGGMVISWAVKRFYDLARQSSRADSMAPYLAGVGIGAAYGIWVLGNNRPPLARVPLGAAVWLGDPAKTAAPAAEGKHMSDKARNAALKMATTGLKKVAQKALFA